MTCELSVTESGGVIAVRNGSLEWIDDSEIESFDDEEKFESRLTELQEMWT